MMGNLNIRRLDDETLQGLRIRAARHNISMEEEARRILCQAVAAPLRLGDLALQLFGAENGVELVLPKYTTHEPISFES
jgi:plasmid stability protein